MAMNHGFYVTEAPSSVTAPISVDSALQVVVGTAPVNQLANPAAAVNTPLWASTYAEAVAAVGYDSDFALKNLRTSRIFPYCWIYAAPLPDARCFPDRWSATQTRGIGR